MIHGHWLNRLSLAFAIAVLPSALRAETRVYYCKADGTNYIVTVNTTTRIVMLDDWLLDRVVKLTPYHVDAIRLPEEGAISIGFNVSLTHTSPKTADFELVLFTKKSRSPSGYVGRCNFERQ